MSIAKQMSPSCAPPTFMERADSRIVSTIRLPMCLFMCVDYGLSYRLIAGLGEVDDDADQRRMAGVESASFGPLDRNLNLPLTHLLSPSSNRPKLPNSAPSSFPLPPSRGACATIR